MASSLFHREYLTRLPLPLAQLYRRTNGAKSSEARHNNCYYIFEALIKLVASPAVALYLEEVERDPEQRVVKLNQHLERLALPSLGHWVQILRELARHYGKRPDRDVHPLGHLWQALNVRRRDWDGLLELYRRIKGGPDAGQPAGDQSCSLLEVCEELVNYRNLVFGHGAQRAESYYREQAPLLAPAVNDVLQEDVMGSLWPAGTRLIFLDDLRKKQENEFELTFKELTGERGVSTEPLTLDVAGAEGLASERVAIILPGRQAPLRLDPLLQYREIDLFDEVLFLNRDRNGKQVEYLSYTTGKTLRDEEMVDSMRRLLGRVMGREVSQSDLGRIVDKTRSDVALGEAVEEPVEPTRRMIGDFEILAKLGSGGMGVVYLARQHSLGRLVALKILPAALAGDEVALSRFRREIRILGMCDHPHVVKILASDKTDDGTPYFVMEYVPGCDLSELFDAVKALGDQPISALGGSSFAEALLQAAQHQRETATRGTERTVTAVGSGDDLPRPELDSPAPPSAAREPDLQLPTLEKMTVSGDEAGGYVRSVVAAMRDAARATQYLHEMNVIHRDIKPGNLMLSPDGSRIVLMDLGLAKAKDSDFTQTRSKDFLGTLRYAAPEQLASMMREVGPQADVRSLGATLWELLARRRLFEDAQDSAQLIAMIAERQVPSLRTIDPRIDKDLDTIVARATEIKTTDRISSAGELADYLELYLHGQELPIRPRSAGEQAMRWARDNKLVSGLAASVAAVILVALLVTSVMWQRTAAAERRSLRAEEAARNTVNDYFVETSQFDELNLPSLKTLRNDLLVKAESYYQAFLENQEFVRDLPLEIGKTQYRLGVIQLATVGPAEAVTYYETSLTTLKALPAGEERDQFLAMAVNRLGEAHQLLCQKFRESNQLEEARRHYDLARDYFVEAREQRAKLAVDYASSDKRPEYVRLEANSWMNRAQLWVSQREVAPTDSAEPYGYPQALRDLEQAQDIREKLLGESELGAETLKKVRIDSSKGAYNLGKLELDWGLTLVETDIDDAKNHFQAARDHSALAAKFVVDLLEGDSTGVDLVSLELENLAAASYQQWGGAWRELAHAAAIQAEWDAYVPRVTKSLQALRRSQAYRQALYQRDRSGYQYEMAQFHADIGDTILEFHDTLRQISNEFPDWRFAGLYSYETALRFLAPIRAEREAAFNELLARITELRNDAVLIDVYTRLFQRRAQEELVLGDEELAAQSLARAWPHLTQLVDALTDGSDTKLTELAASVIMLGVPPDASLAQFLEDSLAVVEKLAGQEGLDETSRGQLVSILDSLQQQLADADAAVEVSAASRTKLGLLRTRLETPE